MRSVEREEYLHVAIDHSLPYEESEDSAEDEGRVDDGEADQELVKSLSELFLAEHTNATHVS